MAVSRGAELVKDCLHPRQQWVQPWVLGTLCPTKSTDYLLIRGASCNGE